VTKLELPTPDVLIFVWPPVDPPGHEWKSKADPADPAQTIQYSPTPVTWELKAVVSPRAAVGRHSIRLGRGTLLSVCNDYGCVNSRPDGRDLPAAELEVVEGPPVAVEPAYRPLVEKAIGSQSPPPPPNGTEASPSSPVEAKPSQSPVEANASERSQRLTQPIEQYEAQLQALRQQLQSTDLAASRAVASGSLWSFLVTAAAWGFITLLTPCVFPMIPITVSIFLKQGNQSPRQALLLAAVYSLTIILVLGVSAFFLLSTFVELSTDPWMNLGLSLIFLVFALSLFGLYEVTLSIVVVLAIGVSALVLLPRLLAASGSEMGWLVGPASAALAGGAYMLLHRSRSESQLLGYLTQKHSGGGIGGTIFGAIAFTLVGFTCVAPFLGGFVGLTASGRLTSFELLLGALAYATAFAAPFFLLALFPSLLRRLPRSGHWLETIKVVMGFLELAAALKFLRTAELRWLPEPAYCTYDCVLACWIALSAVCGLYLLRLFRLPYDEEVAPIGVGRLITAVAFLALAAYLTPALFLGPDRQPQRPRGAIFAWIDAFLLPEPARETELTWHYDLPQTIRQLAEHARRSSRPQPLFLDFTGVTCTNCKYNEFQVFPQPRIRQLLQQYARVQLYTDEVPAALYAVDPGSSRRVREAQANRLFKIDLFGNDQLPLYAVIWVQPDGRVVLRSVYDEGKINEPERFAAWLAAGLPQ
jgi:thiol:disulfide interchange protein DsbD